MGGTQAGARHGLAGRRARAAWYLASGLALALCLFVVYQFGAAARAALPRPAGESPARVAARVHEESGPARPARAPASDLRLELARALSRSVRAAQGGPVESSPRAASSPASAPLARGTAQDALRAAVPLLRECYETLLAEQPDAGSVELQVSATIDADPALGGVLSSAELSGGELESRPEFARCLRETLLSVEFEADTRAGQASVRFPLRFAPSASPSAQRGEPPPR